MNALKHFLTPTLYQLFPIGCDDVALFVCGMKRDAADLDVLRAFQDHVGKSAPSVDAAPLPISIAMDEMQSEVHEFFIDPIPQHGWREIEITQGSFPKNVTTVALNAIFTQLQEKLGCTHIVRPKNANNQGCEWTLATLRSQAPPSLPTLELIYIELKDRRNTRLDEIARKVSAVTIDTWKAESEILTLREKCTVRQLLVIAGRCNDVYRIERGTPEQCNAQRRKPTTK